MTRAVERGARDASALLRRLDPRQRRALELFRELGVVTTAEIAAHLGLAPRSAAPICRRWVGQGFLVVHDPSRKSRSYRLGDAYEDLVVTG